MMVVVIAVVVVVVVVVVVDVSVTTATTIDPFGDAGPPSFSDAVPPIHLLSCLVKARSAPLKVQSTTMLVL